MSSIINGRAAVNSRTVKRTPSEPEDKALDILVNVDEKCAALRALTSPVRVRILLYLSDHGSKSVSDLADALAESVPNINSACVALSNNSVNGIQRNPAERREYMIRAEGEKLLDVFKSVKY